MWTWEKPQLCGIARWDSLSPIHYGETIDFMMDIVEELFKNLFLFENYQESRNTHPTLISLSVEAYHRCPL